MGDRAAARLRRAGELFRPREPGGFTTSATRHVWNLSGDVRVFVERVQLDICGDAVAIGTVVGSFWRAAGWMCRHDPVGYRVFWSGGRARHRIFFCGTISFRNRRSANFPGKLESDRLLVPNVRTEPGN